MFFLNLSPKGKDYLILSIFNKTSISDIRGLLLNCLSKLFNVHAVCWYCLWLSLHRLQISPYLLKTPCTSDTKIREPWAGSDINGLCLRTSFYSTRSAIWTSKGWDNQQPNPAMTPVNLNNQHNTTNIRGYSVYLVVTNSSLTEYETCSTRLKSCEARNYNQMFSATELVDLEETLQLPLLNQDDT